MLVFRRSGILLKWDLPFLAGGELKEKQLGTITGAVWDLQEFRKKPFSKYKTDKRLVVGNQHSTKSYLLRRELTFSEDNNSILEDFVSGKDITGLQEYITSRVGSMKSVPNNWCYSYLRCVSKCDIDEIRLKEYITFLDTNIPLSNDFTGKLDIWALYIGLISNYDLLLAEKKLKSLLQSRTASREFLNSVIKHVDDVDHAIRLFNQIVSATNVTPDNITVDILTQKVPENDIRKLQRFMFIEWGLGTG